MVLTREGARSAISRRCPTVHTASYTSALDAAHAKLRTTTRSFFDRVDPVHVACKPDPWDGDQRAPRILKHMDPLIAIVMSFITSEPRVLDIYLHHDFGCSVHSAVDAVAYTVARC
jgi:hypothetical protein